MIILWSDAGKGKHDHWPWSMSSRLLTPSGFNMHGCNSHQHFLSLTVLYLVSHSCAGPLLKQVSRMLNKSTYRSIAVIDEFGKVCDAVEFKSKACSFILKQLPFVLKCDFLKCYDSWWRESLHLRQKGSEATCPERSNLAIEQILS